MFCVRRIFLVSLIVYALVVQLVDLSFIVIILDAGSRQDFPWGILLETVCVGLGFAGIRILGRQSPETNGIFVRLLCFYDSMLLCFNIVFFAWIVVCWILFG